MEVIIQPDAESGSLVGARIVAALVKRKPDAVLGLAAGGTPVRLYAELVRMHQEEGLDFSRVTTFGLDEYVGLDPEHPQSYSRFIREHFLNRVDLPGDRSHFPDGMAEDIPATCALYERSIARAGGIDLQLLGIGADGHIAFNEPTSSLASRTRIKTITEQTRRDNAKYFAGLREVPMHVVTMGVGTILEARTCVLLAFGSSKAEAVAAAVEGPVTSVITASALQHHADTKVIADELAAACFTRGDYYRWVYDHKPDWQRY